MLSALAQLLGEALTQHGRELPGDGLEDVAARWSHPGEQPLETLDRALREHGLILPAGPRAQVAWTLLGVERPRSVRLGPAAPTRLTHLVEWHDMALPSAAQALARQLRRERTLEPDLLRARPGLEGAGRVVEAVFETEWSGFLALLGEVGPWVYVPSVADLQALSRQYATVVGRAAAGRDPDLLAAALHLARRWGNFPPPLIARLEVTDHRPPPQETGPLHADPATVPALVGVESVFWEEARRLAERRREEWAARRGRR